MRRRSLFDVLSLGTAVLLASLCAVWAVAAARRARPSPWTTSQRSAVRLSDATRARLLRLDGDVTLTYFHSPAAHLPTEMRGLQDLVRELFERMERAARASAAAGAGTLRWEFVDPDAAPELLAYAARARATPVRVRAVQRDAWTERSVWSTVAVAYGGRPRATVPALTADNVDALQAWIVAELDQLERPSPVRIAWSAPSTGFGALEQRLRAAVGAGELRRVEGPRALRDEDARGAGASCDLFLWLAPNAPGEDDARALLELVERGGSAVVAGAAWRALAEAGSTVVRFEESSCEGAAFWSTLGLRPLPGAVFDADNEAEHGGPPRPWRVRCIAPNQDFRSFLSQPNGTLALTCPSALMPDAARLDALGLDFTPIATSSSEAWLDQPPRALTASTELVRERGAALPKATLAALLSSRDARRGSLVVFGSESPFEDDQLGREDAAHARLLAVLLEQYSRPERLVAARLPHSGPPSAPTLDAAARARWRALTLGAAPALLLAWVFLRRRREPSRRAAPDSRAMRRTASARRAALPMLGALLALLIGSAANALRGRASLQLDATRDRAHTLAPATLGLARALPQPLRATLAVSSGLEGELASLQRRALDLLSALSSSVAGGVETTVLDPERLDEAQRAELARRGALPFARVSREGDLVRTRTVDASLLLACGEREEALVFRDDASAERLEFRVALALARLSPDAGGAGARGRIALACDTPRLSPAEAHLEYQQRGLFAPTGADVFALARQTLERAGFDVRPINPSAPDGKVPEGADGAAPAADAGDDFDLLVWLQPRRDTQPMLSKVARTLARGGKVLIAGQHYKVRSRQLEAQQFRTLHWPEPQFCDLDQGALAELGLKLEREVLCDADPAALELPTEVERVGGGRDFVLQESSLPFQLRALAPRDARFAALGDAVYLWGNRWSVDAERCARAGLAVATLHETSPAAWRIAWKGGDLDPRALDAAAPDLALAGEMEGIERVGAAPLGLWVEGPFPDASGRPARAPGTLALLGSSEMFTNRELERDGAQAGELLVRLAARLALGDDFASILERRARPAGFRPPPPAERAALRALAVAAFPALLVLGLLAWRIARAARRTAGSGTLVAGTSKGAA